MNSRQLQYAILLSEVKNFSQVAEKLNISQPALSKQILNLENELGIKLFDRSTMPLSLTPAGQHFIQEAQELLYKEDQLLRSLEQFKSGEAGQLVIGTTPFRSSYLIPAIMKDFRKAYPFIQLTLHEAGVDVLRKEAAEGKFDFAVVNLPVDEANLNVTPLQPDRLVLVVPNTLTHLIPNAQQLQEITFDMCKALPFATVHPAQEMRRLLEKLCAAYSFHPQIAAEVVGLNTAWAVVNAGVAATILPAQFVNCQPENSTLTIFPVKDAVSIRQPAIITRKGQYISAPAQYAMELLRNHAK